MGYIKMISGEKKARLVLILIALALSGASAQDYSDLYKEISPSVVVVVAYDKNNTPISQGSGFS